MSIIDNIEESMTLKTSMERFRRKYYKVFVEGDNLTFSISDSVDTRNVIIKGDFGEGKKSYDVDITLFLDKVSFALPFHALVYKKGSSFRDGGILNFHPDKMIMLDEYDLSYSVNINEAFRPVTLVRKFKRQTIRGSKMNYRLSYPYPYTAKKGVDVYKIDYVKRLLIFYGHRGKGEENILVDIDDKDSNYIERQITTWSSSFYNLFSISVVNSTFSPSKEFTDFFIKSPEMGEVIKSYVRGDG